MRSTGRWGSNSGQLTSGQITGSIGEIGARDQFGCTSPFVPEHLRQGLEICANATIGAKVDSDANDNDKDDDENDDNNGTNDG